ncbi:MAG: DEAD/DEAH box helicase [Clostridia bacterium]|nr:DEAD/DEAH box helicase [Clostridia bacterium]
MSEKAFESLNLSEEVLRAVKDEGWTEMTDIQESAIPHVLAGEDVIGQSSTGTGKTGAFGIPMIERINEKKKDPQALVLCPTRELAMQVCGELCKIAKYKDVKTVAVYGGQNMDTQLKGMEGADVIVGTPGRIIDHLKRHTLSLNEVKTVVLDEADEMLNMGFLDDIRMILGNAPDERQTLLFSATMPTPILRISQRFQKSPHLIKGDDGQTAFDLIEQYYCEVPRNKKTACAAQLFKQTGAKRALIFCNTKIMVDILTKRLCEAGLSARSIHGDMAQGARTRVMSGFKDGSINLLVATDVAARGIDASDIDIIINYDIPEDPDFYVHRIGRTGRAGKNGASFTLVAGSGEFFDMATVQERTGIQMKEYEIEGVDALPEDKKRVAPERKKEDRPRREKRRTSGSGKTGRVKIDVGSKCDVRAVHVIDALIRFGKVSRGDIGDIEIGEDETTATVRGDAELIAKAMNDNAATVFDFLVNCEKI